MSFRPSVTGTQDTLTTVVVTFLLHLLTKVPSIPYASTELSGNKGRREGRLKEVNVARRPNFGNILGTHKNQNHHFHRENS